MKYVTTILSLLFFAATLHAQVQHNTADNPIVICNTSFTLDAFERNSDALLDIDGTCLEYPKLLSTVWIAFEIEKGKELSFVLTPLDSDDDIDFVLYEVDDALQSYQSRTLLRCVATGLNLGDNKTSQQNCVGPTGMFYGASDITETSGCNSLKDNFVDAVHTYSGMKYILLVTNFDATSGFILDILGATKLAELDECSETVSTEVVQIENIKLGPVVPNPLSNEGSITITTTKHLQLDMIITDLMGRMVNKSTIHALSGETIARFNTDRFVSGLYTLSLFDAGELVATRKFIKH